MFSEKLKTPYSLLAIVFLLQACSSPSSSRYQISQDHGPDKSVDVSHVKNAVPKKEAKSKYGNPKTYLLLKW